MRLLDRWQGITADVRRDAERWRAFDRFNSMKGGGPAAYKDDAALKWLEAVRIDLRRLVRRAPLGAYEATSKIVGGLILLRRYELIKAGTDFDRLDLWLDREETGKRSSEGER